jgi:hypothetical protein
MFYFWLPFLISVVVVLLYERNRLASAIKGGPTVEATPGPPLTAPGINPEALDARIRKTPV